MPAIWAVDIMFTNDFSLEKNHSFHYLLDRTHKNADRIITRIESNEELETAIKVMSKYNNNICKFCINLFDRD